MYRPMNSRFLLLLRLRVCRSPKCGGGAAGELPGGRVHVGVVAKLTAALVPAEGVSRQQDGRARLFRAGASR